jgi:hypothetical protein
MCLSKLRAQDDQYVRLPLALHEHINIALAYAAFPRASGLRVRLRNYIDAAEAFRPCTCTIFPNSGPLIVPVTADEDRVITLPPGRSKS